MQHILHRIQEVQDAAFSPRMMIVENRRVAVPTQDRASQLRRAGELLIASVYQAFRDRSIIGHLQRNEICCYKV